MKQIIQYMPCRLRQLCAPWCHSEVQEIRVHKGGSFAVVSEGNAVVPKKNYVVTEREFNQLLESLCGNSLYTYEDEIRKGYFTLREGHRVGVAGHVLMEQGRVKTIRNITSLNIRISHEKKGCGNPVIEHLINGATFLSTLIVSPPGCGKTTLLRDLVRILAGKTYRNSIALIDERSEIAGCYRGVPRNDVGENCFVMDGCEKSVGIEMMIRSMSPNIVAVDEIGIKKDAEALQKALCQGVKILATAHGSSYEDVCHLPDLWSLIGKDKISRIVFLNAYGGPGEIREIVDERGSRLV
ncbi:MAG: stage III sporulation protein AA [Eubacterium sp.]|nr:stage III sporulation protein AA [Eubacterium sp.]